MGNKILYGTRECDGIEIDGRLFVDVEDVARLMGFRAMPHKLGMRIHENVIPIDTAWGSFRGIQIGCVPYCSAPAIFEAAGYRVERFERHGQYMVFIHERFVEL